MIVGGGEESVTEAVCRVGDGSRYNKAVLPCGWQRTEESFPREESGTAVSKIRSVVVHSNHRHTHQNLCHLADQ